jgi:ABC-type lipoprotein release transport system permease subunit
MQGLGQNFSTLLTLSWRNLWRNHRRTGIMLGAIAVGVWAMIFMTALMRGMVDDMLNQGIRNLPGHIQIQHPEFLDDPSVVNSMPEPDGELLAALNRPGVKRWASRIRVPAVMRQALGQPHQGTGGDRQRTRKPRHQPARGRPRGRG